MFSFNLILGSRKILNNIKQTSAWLDSSWLVFLYCLQTLNVAKYGVLIIRTEFRYAKQMCITFQSFRYNDFKVGGCQTTSMLKCYTNKITTFTKYNILFYG